MTARWYTDIGGGSELDCNCSGSCWCYYVEPTCDVCGEDLAPYDEIVTADGERVHSEGSCLEIARCQAHAAWRVS